MHEADPTDRVKRCKSAVVASPVWGATLRRVAATALVLVVGLDGLTAPVSADPLRPVSTIRPPADLQVAVDAPAGLSVAGSVAAGSGLCATTVAWATGAGATTADSPHRLLRAASTAPTSGVPSRQADAAPSRPDATAVLPTTDPGRESVARRGPPRA